MLKLLFAQKYKLGEKGYKQYFVQHSITFRALTKFENIS